MSIKRQFHVGDSTINCVENVDEAPTAALEAASVSVLKRINQIYLEGLHRIEKGGDMPFTSEACIELGVRFAQLGVVLKAIEDRSGPSPSIGSVRHAVMSAIKRTGSSDSWGRSDVFVRYQTSERVDYYLILDRMEALEARARSSGAEQVDWVGGLQR